MYQLKQFHKKDNPVGFNPGLTAQPKLRIGQRGDQYEQQADAVADGVMKVTSNDEVRMQPFEEEKEMMMPKLQMQPEEEEEPIQMKPSIPRTGNGNDFASDQVTKKLSTTKGSGQRLPGNIEAEMGNKIGADFSGVRIHTGHSAVQMNRELGARAFTIGNDIYFNSGNYQPEGHQGKHLLAHELTHVIQQGAVLRPMIQKQDGSAELEGESSSGGSNQFAHLVAGLLRDQLSNSSMRSHLSSLGTALQGLAVESTGEGASQPAAGAERLAALNIEGAFETTARAILNDRSFQALRERLIGIAGSSDEGALVVALAAALALVLADIPLRGTPSQDLGAGFSVGGSFDLGSIRSLQFNNLSAYAQYATTYFQSRISGTVSRDQGTGDFAGAGTGQIRLGSNTSHLLGRLTINHEGEVVLMGRLSAGYTFGGSDRLIFTTDLSHSFATGESIITPGVSGSFNLGHEQSLRLGSRVQISTDSGLTGVTGFIEYRRDQLRLRIEGSMNGLAEETGISPGGNMQIQGMLTIPF